MLLTTPIANEWLSVQATALTVVEPGKRVELQLELIATQAVTAVDVLWEIPPSLKIKPDPGKEIFPYSFQPGDSYQATLNIETEPGQEGFGEIGISILLDGGTQKIPPINWSFWLSVYKRADASKQKELSNELRQRLIEVVNARDRNGHILISNFGAFFDDFLNIEISPALARIVGMDLGLPSEGLPLDLEMYYLFILGRKSFYGITRVELIAAEYCVESDNRFDPDQTREVEQIIL